METLLRLWSLASTGIVALYVGWGAARFGIVWHTLLAFVVFALLWWQWLLRLPKRMPRKKRTDIITTVCLCATALFLFGAFAAQTNYRQVNDWLDNSATSITTAIHPVKRYGRGTASGVIIDPARLKKMERSLMDLRISGGVLGRKILVSFEQGMAIVDNTRVQFLLGTSSQLSLSTPFDDGSFLYYSDINTQDTPTDKPQTLTRALVRDGKLYRIWERNTLGLYLNHWGDWYQGEIYYPGREFRDLPNDVSKKIGGNFANCKEKNSIHEVIRVFDIETGELKRSIDLAPAIIALTKKDPAVAKMMMNCHDPLHFNDIQFLKTEKEAGFFPGGKVGDFLISLRNINAILLVDGQTHQMKWYVFNLFKKQHSPRVTDRGTMLVFDNLGSDAANGRSRILEIDIASRKTVGLWEARGDNHFDSNVRGKASPLGKYVLVQYQDIYYREKANSLFLLDCPDRPISLSCKQITVFSGKAPEFRYDNAILLDE